METHHPKTPGESWLLRAAARVRAHGAGFSVEVAANFVLPFLVYHFGHDTVGDVRALMASAVPPILWSVAGFARERRIDAISILVIAGIALSLLAFAGGGGVKFLQLRENLVTGLVGLVFLGSVAIGRPLIYHLARAGMRRRAPDKVAWLEDMRRDAGLRRAMMIATLVWGWGMVGVCTLSCALVFTVSIERFLLINPLIGYTCLGSLTAWTFWYVPRAIRSALARAESSTCAVDSRTGRPGPD